MARDTVAQLAPPPIRPTQPSDELQTALQSVQTRYPIFRDIPAVIQRESGPGHLEFYSPFEPYNPNPGKVTLGIRNAQLKGQELHDMVAGDLLHHLGAKTPSGEPVHPQFRRAKEQFIRSMTPHQQQIAYKHYVRVKEQGQIDPRVSYQDFLDFSASDAFIRGYLFPDKRDEWRQPGYGQYTKPQKQLLDQMKEMVHGRSK